MLQDTYLVETVSLKDLLIEHSAPPHINYLSIDTEGSELNIIKKFDFNSHTFDFISIEHNYRPDRHEIHELISSRGYRRIHKKLSRCEFWYEKLDWLNWMTNTWSYVQKVSFKVLRIVVHKTQFSHNSGELDSRTSHF